MRTPRPPRRPRSLAGQIFAMQVVLVAFVVAGCVAFAYVTDRIQAEESARDRAHAAATAVARSPSVAEAIRTVEPSKELQPYAESVRRGTGVTFITIMDPDRVRWTHPDPDRIGGLFAGHTGPALKGRTFHETYTGSFGPSVRVVTPVRDEGRIVGLVSAGITVERISEQLQQQVVMLFGVAGAALAVGGFGTYVVNSRLRRHTHGMNARELTRLHEYHRATLHAVHEGLVMLDGRQRVALINDGARELLGLPQQEALTGRHVAELGLPEALTEALSEARPRVNEPHLTADRVVIVNTSPVSGGEQHGTVITLRDHTELQALLGELDSQRGFTEALRSQAHEAANRLHTVVSLVELGRTDDAVDFATEELELAQALTDTVVAAVGEPVLAALLLGKAAQANEHGIELELTPDSRLDDGILPAGATTRDLVTILGNLIDNALDAATEGGGPPRVTVTVRTEQDSPGAPQLFVRVRDSGLGVPDDAEEDVFRRGWSTKEEGGRGIGLALVRQAAHRHGGDASVTRGPDGGAEFTVRMPLPAGAAV